VTFAENEEALPVGWKPLHMLLGAKTESSAVTIYSGYGITHWNNTFIMPHSKGILEVCGRILPSGGLLTGASSLLTSCGRDACRRGLQDKGGFQRVGL